MSIITKTTEVGVVIFSDDDYQQFFTIETRSGAPISSQYMREIKGLVVEIGKTENNYYLNNNNYFVKIRSIYIDDKNSCISVKIVIIIEEFTSANLVKKIYDIVSNKQNNLENLLIKDISIQKSSFTSGYFNPLIHKPKDQLVTFDEYYANAKYF